MFWTVNEVSDGVDKASSAFATGVKDDAREDGVRGAEDLLADAQTRQKESLHAITLL